MTNGLYLKEMPTNLLAKELIKDRCSMCAYNYDVSCHDAECIEGIEEWLNQERKQAKKEW